MPHVVTQSCVGDGSCVHACPVNCIQPTPDDPAFELADMLHIDPVTCVDCGACVRSCPVDAIKPRRLLDDAELAFAAINADYHRKRGGPRPSLAPVRAPLVVRDHGRPLRVAIVGSGPAAMYAAEEVLTIPGAQVSVYEREAVPDGLVRAGVAPDHRRTRRVSRQLERIRRHPRLTLHLGVDVGVAVTLDELRAGHDAVVYGVGAAGDRRLDVPGADLPHVVSARAFVGWYTGTGERTFDLSGVRRVVVIGNGNVALDVARILTMDPDALEESDIAPAALAGLRASRVEAMVVTARRGPAEAAFTRSELIGLAGTPGVSVLSGPLGEAAGPKVDALRALPPARPGTRTVELRFGATPTAIRAGTVTLGEETLDADLVLTAIGYHGLPIVDLPHDPVSGTVPNTGGRVEPGVYVVGWAKRGASGQIGTNRACAQDTVAALVDDHNAGRLGERLVTN